MTAAAISCLCLSFTSYSQGIKWENELTWKEILQKAKKENKFIFADCYATWCGPCKKMDENVYTLDRVGEYLDKNFISIKLQMDTTKNDSEEIKKRYTDAADVMRTFQVRAFPTYLYFSPDGKIVHRFSGMVTDTGFLRLASNAQDSNKQYYIIKEKYRKGQRGFSLNYLSNLANIVGEKDFSHIVAEEYINTELLRLPKNVLFTNENVRFLALHTQNTMSRSFRFFLDHASSVDSIMKIKNYSQGVIDFAITSEKISSVLTMSDEKNITVNWDKIFLSIKKQFGQVYAERNVLNAQIRWYKYKNQWEKYAAVLIKRVDKYGSFGLGIADFDLNNHAWEIFLHSNDKLQLQKALGWSDSAIKINPDYANSLDTYANLLYKLGKKEKAIEWQKKAIELDLKNAKKANVKPGEDYAKNLEKMKRGEPTW